MPREALVQSIQSAITDEVFFALGLRRRGIVRRSLGWVFSWPTRIFARYLAVVDEAVEIGGVPAGCQKMLDFLKIEPEVMGKSNIPVDGPTIILCNHPGATDSISIGSQVPRTDLKIIASRTRLYQNLPHIYPDLFTVGEDPPDKMVTLREILAHLKNGGSLLQFGSGLIEPDPEMRHVTNAVFEKWSPSLEIFLRKVSETKVVPTIASGVLLQRFIDHPLVKFRQDAMDQRRLAAFLQIIQQLLFPKTVSTKPHVSFGESFALSDIAGKEGKKKKLMPEVIKAVKGQLATHLDWISGREDRYKAY